jgi:hypothetical protein
VKRKWHASRGDQNSLPSVRPSELPIQMMSYAHIHTTAAYKLRPSNPASRKSEDTVYITYILHYIYIYTVYMVFWIKTFLPTLYKVPNLFLSHTPQSRSLILFVRPEPFQFVYYFLFLFQNYNSGGHRRRDSSPPSTTIHVTVDHHDYCDNFDVSSRHHYNIIISPDTCRLCFRYYFNKFRLGTWPSFCAVIHALHLRRLYRTRFH